jgi:hypothetical protein
LEFFQGAYWDKKREIAVWKIMEEFNTEFREVGSLFGTV